MPERFLAALPVADLTFAVVILAGLYMLPSSTDVWGGLGNVATCQAAAFGMTISSIAVSWANANVVLYFCVKVSRHGSDAAMSRWWEPWGHGLPRIVALGVGSVKVLDTTVVALCTFLTALVDADT